MAIFQTLRGALIAAAFLSLSACATRPFDEVGTRFKYQVPFELGLTETSDSDRIEITEVWGTRPQIEVGGAYLVAGNYSLQSLEQASLSLSLTANNWNNSGPGTDPQSQTVNQGSGTFTLLHTMEGPGWFHVSLGGQRDGKHVRVVNLYFGTGETLLGAKASANLDRRRSPSIASAEPEAPASRAGKLLADAKVAPPEPPGPISEPSVDRIDYSQPNEYLVLSASLGNADRIRALAATLKGGTPERTLVNIGRWMDASLKCDDAAFDDWTNYNCDIAFEQKIYGGCASHAVVFAALARACGIPAIFVKTMDAGWIREFRTTGTCTVWRGHVFLEVFLAGHWKLLDATGLCLYDDYDPAMRILPGDRYAYDKGVDPRELILSFDWERWKQQTADYFKNFDLTLLPVGTGRTIGKVHVTANSPVWQAIDRRMQELGRACFSFNGDFENHLPQAKGGDLVITCVGEEVVLPKEYHARYLPISLGELREKMRTGSGGVVRKILDDGTKVALIYGKDVDSILTIVESFDLEAR